MIKIYVVGTCLEWVIRLITNIVYMIVRQCMIMCLYGDLLGARMNEFVWEFGVGAGICAYTIIWHMRGYLRSRELGACAGIYLSSKFRFAVEGLN